MSNNILFVVQRPPYKSENPKLAITHAMSCYTADIHIDEPVEPTLAYVGDGVLNCIRDQRSQDIYGLISTEQHIKVQLSGDMKILVCKEDIERLGIKEERLVDGKDLGAEAGLNVVPFKEILKEMEICDHLMFF
ncbi:MAG: DsrE family protein [Nitrospinae bacterium]|nr:DsrE family protein [Nitrospinota bacterium]